MEATTAIRLLTLNRQFYAQFGAAFSVTRRRIQPGVRRILGTISPDETILDLGCGNGELARQLARRGHRAPYLGLDFSLSVLGDARRVPDGFPARFLHVDLTSTNWDEGIRDSGYWSLVTAFAVLHHVPSAHLRLNILKKVHQLLAPAGRFIHSEWQFLNSPRLRARVQPWERIGLTGRDVDTGDYLLDWRRGGEGLRYVHHFDEAELAELAVASGFRAAETFYSDGENGRLGMYQIWQKA